MLFGEKMNCFVSFLGKNVALFSNIGIHTNAINNLPIIYVPFIIILIFFSGMFTEIKQMNKVKSVYILRIDCFL